MARVTRGWALMFVLSLYCRTPRGARADTSVVQPDRGLSVGDATLRVEQDGRVLPIVDGVVTLKARPFAFLFSLPIGHAILLHAFTSDEHQRRVRARRRLDEAFPTEGNGMAEFPKNRDRTLFISPDAYSYWYYQSASDHRFDTARPHGQRVEVRRTVSSLTWVTESAGPAEPLSKLRAQKLYLVLLWPPSIADARPSSPAVLTLAFAP
jgi:hypothetical protein